MPEFQININIGGNNGISGAQDLPDVAVLTDGRFVVTYQSDYLGSATDPDPIVAVFNPDGTTSLAYSDVFNANGRQAVTAVAERLGGGFAVVFQNDHHANNTVDANGPNITYVPVSSAGAGGFPDAIAVADFNSGAGHDALQNPAIATLSTGRQVVAFERVWTLGTDHDVFLNVVNEAGTATQFSISNPLDVVANASWAANPAVAAIGNQALVAIEDGTDTATASANIRARIFDGDTNALGAAFVIADHAARLRTPDVAAIDDHRYAVVYGDQNDVWWKIYDTTAGTLSAEVQVDVEGGFALNPQVAGLPGGGFIVTWANYNGADYDVRARPFDSSGNAIGSDFIATLLTNASQFTPTVAVSDDHVLFAWTDFAARPEDTAAPGVRGRSFGMAVGDALDNLLSGGAGEDLMLGGAGSDVYFVDNAGDVVAESASEGTDTIQTALASFSMAGFANVEILVGVSAFAQFLTGNTGNNTIVALSAGADTLNGLGGNDVLDGGAGADALVGGLGNDNYVVDNVFDTISENLAEGTDTVFPTVSYSLAANVENLIMQGVANINALGNGLDNSMVGNSGNNSIDGGASADTMVGANGDDTYFVDNSFDAISESSGDGFDIVFASVSYALSINVENLVLTGVGNNNGSGNGLVNTLTGNAGNNSLDGGAGVDTMVGGAGNDTYFVDSSFEGVSELSGEGMDVVFSSASYALQINVENLVLTGAANVNATGNDLVNSITGNSGINSLDGAVGADIMTGGNGNDTYYVDSSFDTIVENPGEGTDSVAAIASYALSANVENLTLTGMGNINGSGNSLVNTLTGNSGNNVLDGGVGADVYIGGAGNDVYFVDNNFEVINENFNDGTDTIYSSVSYQLGSNLEFLYLQGAGNINGFGNSLTNFIQGNGGDNGIDGGGGTDALYGMGGNDLFIFRAGQANGDILYDFAGNGAGIGDSMQFVGFGPIGGGATFTNVGGNQWQIHSGLDAHNEIITLDNGASVHASNFFFT